MEGGRACFEMVFLGMLFLLLEKRDEEAPLIVDPLISIPFDTVRTKDDFVRCCCCCRRPRRMMTPSWCDDSKIDFLPFVAGADDVNPSATGDTVKITKHRSRIPAVEPTP